MSFGIQHCENEFQQMHVLHCYDAISACRERLYRKPSYKFIHHNITFKIQVKNQISVYFPGRLVSTSPTKTRQKDETCCQAS